MNLKCFRKGTSLPTQLAKARKGLSELFKIHDSLTGAWGDINKESSTQEAAMKSLTHFK